MKIAIYYIIVKIFAMTVTTLSTSVLVDFVLHRANLYTITVSVLMFILIDPSAN